MVIVLLLTVIVVATIFVWFNIQGADLIAERKAIKELEAVLFPKGMAQKQQVIAAIHQITNNRLNNEDALDYFLKIKGLQVINLHDPISYWTRKYLMAPTKTKLNYFEQVHFYEQFLNYPEGNKNLTNQSGLAGYPLTEAAKGLLKSTEVAKMLA
ncbi:MAG: hypothetical protein QM786_02330 [Breznakibacter sp.]